MGGGARPTPFLAIGQTQRKGNGGCYTENKKIQERDERLCVSVYVSIAASNWGGGGGETGQRESNINIE